MSFRVAARRWKNVFLAFRQIISSCTHLVFTSLLPQREREDGVATKTASETVQTPLPPYLLGERGRGRLREASSLLYVLEGRASYLTLGALLSLADNDVGGN